MALVFFLSENANFLPNWTAFCAADWFRSFWRSGISNELRFCWVRATGLSYWVILHEDETNDAEKNHENENGPCESVKTGTDQCPHKRFRNIVLCNGPVDHRLNPESAGRMRLIARPS